jgi:hypothetical protein
MRVSQWIFGAALGLAATSSQATLLTFEDIGVQGSVYPFYTQAGFVESGFRFSNNADVVDLVGSAWPYGAHSGDFAALNDYGGNMVITVDGGGTFSFQDAYLKGWANQGGASSSIAGYLGNTLVGQVNFTMASDWQNVAGNFANIDRLVVSGNTFLVDDLTLNGGSVPEPATLGLMGLGLIGMASLRRKRK